MIQDFKIGPGIFFLVMILIAIPLIVFRYNQPHMTETELFLNFFTAFSEFFNRY